MHYHIMHYMPGYLADGDILTADTIADAREVLADEIDTVTDHMIERGDDPEDTTGNVGMIETLRSDREGDITSALERGAYYVYDVDGYTYAAERCEATDCEHIAE